MLYGPAGTSLARSLSLSIWKVHCESRQEAETQDPLALCGRSCLGTADGPFPGVCVLAFNREKDSEPSTLDSQSSTTLFLSSEEPGPSTAALPSPSSSCEPSAFSPGPPALPHLLPSLPAAPAPPASGSGAPRRAGLHSVVASSPEAVSRLLDWLPSGPSATPPGPRGDERDRPGPRAPRPGAAGREEGAEDLRASPQPCARPAASASLEANVGDILVELRTMNGHLDVIARALTKLASSLGPQPPTPPDAPDAK
ncbi:vegetative cell wall protein gp1-like isoform X2 [Cervus elaphus]|uniref:vegetative cell wall protein gp1-like isoform X2 n=1 Tax=Cervus elaphus TaxID=9860 RepID=UPI001CC2A80C|nr:vegetative cell wall protein gp1-like isoform X2 [Cervus elaphus]